MKRLLAIISVFLVLAGCNRGPEVIPDYILKDMLEDLMITDAVMTQLNIADVDDSMDYYQPIFDKYGYTQKDMEYTFKQLAARQSKPLTNIYDVIVADLADLSQDIRYNYAKREASDNLAMVCYSDTLFRSNDSLVGVTGKFKAVIENPVKGKYHFTFMYKGVREMSFPLRKVISELKYKDKSRAPRRQESWVSRSYKPNAIRMVVDVKDSSLYDSLVFTIKDPDYSKTKFTVKQDTSCSYRFRVLYIPDRRDARGAYFRKITGFDLSKLVHPSEEKLFDLIRGEEEDSCSMGPLGKR